MSLVCPTLIDVLRMSDAYTAPIVAIYEAGDGTYVKRGIEIWDLRKKALVATLNVLCKYIAKLTIDPEGLCCFTTSVPDGLNFCRPLVSTAVKFVPCEAVFAVHITTDTVYVGDAKGINCSFLLFLMF